MQTSSALHAAAMAAVNAGFQIAAIAHDKRPAHAEGFMERPATDISAEALDVITAGRAEGLRVELGQRGARPDGDGGFRIPLALEFEGKTSGSDEWDRRWAEALDILGLGDLFTTLESGVVHATPSGGRRWFFEVVTDDLATTLPKATAARWKGETGPVTMAELLTRDAIIAPSSGRTHPTGRPYVRVQGSFVSDLPTLDIADVEALCLLLEEVSDSGLREGTETLTGLTGTARQVRAAHRTVGTPQQSLDLLLQHGWRVLHGALPADVALVRPGSSSTEPHAHVGGERRPHGQVSVWTTSEPTLPQGRHDAFSLIAHLEHGGKADRAAKALVGKVELPQMVLRAADRPYVNIGQNAESIDAIQDLVSAVGKARAAHDPQAPMVLRHVTPEGTATGLVIPQRGLPPRRIGERESSSLFLRVAQPVSGWREVKDEDGKGTGVKVPVNAHTIPDGLRTTAFQEAMTSGAVPAVEIIAAEPVLLRGGRTVATSGFHADDRVLISMPLRERAWWAEGYAVPQAPSKEDAQEALDFILAEVLLDFPFVDDGDRARAVALLLTATSTALASKRPAFMTVAPDRGTGKSLLNEVVRTIAAGTATAAEISPYKSKDEENGKIIASAIAGGVRFISVDNADTGAKVTSTLMTTMITKADGEHMLRLLGSNDQVAASGLVWTVSGNSIVLGGDLQRRFLPINLEVNEGLAFERTGFRHRDLLGWVSAHRPQLLAACHTILAHGQQNPIDAPFTMATFEGWSDVVVGSLSHLTITDAEGKAHNAGALVGKGRGDFVDGNDDEGEEWAELLAYVAEITAERTLTAGQIAAKLEPGVGTAKPQLDLPREVFEVLSYNPNGRPRRLAALLRTMRGRKVPHGDAVLKLESHAPGGANSKKSDEWRVVVTARRQGIPSIVSATPMDPNEAPEY